MPWICLFLLHQLLCTHRASDPARGVQKRGVKGIFVLQRAIPWHFCSEISWRQHQPRRLLCPLLVAALEIRSHALPFQKGAETLWPLQLTPLRLRGCLQPQRSSKQSKIPGNGAEGKECLARDGDVKVQMVPMRCWPGRCCTRLLNLGMMIRR